MSSDRSSYTGSLAVLAVASLVLGIAAKTLPLQSARPSDTERRTSSIIATQDVDARLWEDPMSAVRASLTSDAGERAANGSSAPSVGLRKRDPAHAFSTLVDAFRPESTRALAVLITRSMNSEDVEYRRRARYAVISGLLESGYVSTDSARIGYVWGWSPNDPLDRAAHVPDVVPFEWFKCEDSTRCGSGMRRTLVLWLEEESFQYQPILKLRALATALGASDLSIIGPGYAETLKAIVGDIKCGRVSPNQIHEHSECASPPNESSPAPPLRFVSPWISTPSKHTGDREIKQVTDRVSFRRVIAEDDRLVEAIVQELRLRFAIPREQSNNARPALDQPSERQEGRGTLSRAWSHVVLTYKRVMRAIGRNLDRLGHVLLTEHCTLGLTDWLSLPRCSAVPAPLEETRYAGYCAITALRLIPFLDCKPSERLPSTIQPAYLLVYERDTAYSRELKKLIEERIRAACPTRCKVYSVGYMRGLDGLGLDRERASREQSRDTDAKRAAPSDNNRQTLRSNGPHAFGRTQFDYLGRLADTIDPPVDVSSLPDNLRVRAVGIIGNDVYDKLVILQALRERFAHATFFTTDLDARMLQADQVQWTRNLVVAASFGFALNPGLQRATPPFRDSYQTATYFATLLALEQLSSPHSESSSYLGSWSSDPNGRTDQVVPISNPTRFSNSAFGGARVFEIGRTRAVVLDANGAPGECRSLSDCDNFHALQEHNFPEGPATSRKTTAAFVVAIVTAALIFMTWRAPGQLVYRSITLPILICTIIFEFTVAGLRRVRDFFGDGRSASIKRFCANRLPKALAPRASLKGTRFWRDYGNPVLREIWRACLRAAAAIVNGLLSLGSNRAGPTRLLPSRPYVLRVSWGSNREIDPDRPFPATPERFHDALREFRLTIASLAGVMLVVAVGYATTLIAFRLAREGAAGIGEPFLWTEGVSAWPPQVIRVVSIVLCGYFIARSWQTVRDLVADVNKTDPAFGLDRAASILAPSPRKRMRNFFAARGYDIGRWCQLAVLGPFARFGKAASGVMKRTQDRFTVRRHDEKVDAVALWREYCKRIRWHNRFAWTALVTLLLFASQFPVATVADEGSPMMPTRGEIARVVDYLLFNLHSLIAIYLVVNVVYIIGTTRGFIERLLAQPSHWPEPVLQRTADRDRLSHDIVDEWVDFRIVTKMTAAVSPIIYWPFIILVMLYLIRSPVFDAITFPMSLQVLAGACLAYAIHTAYVLRRTAERARTSALQQYERTLMRLRARTGAADAGEAECTARQVELLMARIRGETAGAFSPLAQQPFVRALLIPLGSFGTISLAEYLTLVNM